MIHFVGAGPGAVDLITVRGQQLIREADVIIYAGSLVNPDLLLEAKPDCSIYNSASMTLEEVIGVMVQAEQESKQTVRLHTGDPSLYGAIREQMDCLNQHHIPYQVVPGVSSFCGAAAASKQTVRLHTGDPSLYGAIREQMDCLNQHHIPYQVVPGVSSFCGAAAALQAEYTLPDVSQTVIITRMAGRTPVPPQEEIALLAQHQSTMVIFLSTGMLPQLTERLLAGGYLPDTPAAIVYKATWKDEKVLRCTVQDLAQTAKQHHITKTALILVGRFLGDDYSRSLLYHPTFTHEFREGKNLPQ